MAVWMSFVGKFRYRVRLGAGGVACIMRVSYWLAFGYSTGRLEFSQGCSKVALAGECRGRRNTEEPARTAGVSCRHNIIQAGHCWLDLPYWTTNSGTWTDGRAYRRKESTVV